MSNKSGIAGQIISIPKGGGALQGIGETFKPDLFTGTGNFSIPITLPPGRNGFQPQLSLVYSTGNGNGPFGLGWNLSVPNVSRKTSKGVPRYHDRQDVPLNERDTFILSGAEDLVQVAERNDKGIARFRPRTEGLFAEIEQVLDENENKNFWRVRSKDGLVSLYGTPVVDASDRTMGGDARRVIANPASKQKIFCWMLSETQDTFGNRIAYTYLRDRRESSREGEPERDWDQLYLERIRYIDVEDGRFLASVRFVYDDRERPDRFSSYRSGFEILTRFRCREIEVSTHATEEVVVRTYRLVYHDDLVPSDELPRNPVSLLSQIKVVGHDSGAEEGLPPLTFAYAALDLDGGKFQPLSPTAVALPDESLADDDYELVDLFGNGLPDIVEIKTPIRFWRNTGLGRFQEPEAMTAAPPGVQLSNPGTLFADLNGDARADLLVFEAGGYFPLNFDGEFSKFFPYTSIPPLQLEERNTRFIDLEGDGVTDALVTGESSFFLFFNDAEKGWNGSEERPRASFDAFPNVFFQNTHVKLADLSGDGLQDIVLVENGAIHYWPYLGDGRWARRIETKFRPFINDPSAPQGLGFDPNRVLFADLDGDGLDDLVYVQSNIVTIWINQGGNGWSTPTVIKHDLLFDDPEKEADAVRVADMLGTGTAGILWTADRRPGAEDNYQFLDLTGGVKPYLLTEMNNHMGAITRVQYAPSTKFYLADQEKKETEWKTHLPFPVHVVERVEVIDELSKGKLTTEYRYHHGYWDGIEREFRGFGMVEQQDSEIFERFNAAGLHGTGREFERVERVHFSAPTLTKTWFHLGAIDDESLEHPEIDFSKEYFKKDPLLLARPQAQIEFFKKLPRQDRADALRTLRGTILRTELYALDRQDRPFTVTETLTGLREIEAKEEEDETSDEEVPERKRIFFPHPLAQRTTQWERGDDPLTRLSFTNYQDENDEFDRFGRPHRQTQIACPRGWRKLADKPGSPFLGTVTSTRYASPIDSDIYIVDRVAKITTFEIKNDGSETVFELRDLPDKSPKLHVISQTLNFYDGEGFIGRANGELGDHGALVRSESLVLTEEILREAYKSEDRDAPEIPPYLKPGGPPAWTEEYPQEFREHIQGLRDLAGFTFHVGDDVHERGYFATSARNKFDFQEPGSSKRGLLLTVRDPLGRDPSPGESGRHDTEIEYDKFDLLPIKVTDPVGLVTEAKHDYRVMQLRHVTDPNGNQSDFTFTPLGLLHEIFIQGKDSTEGEFSTEGDQSRPSTLFKYDFMAFENDRQPIFVRKIRHEHHDTETDVESDATIETVEYSDGFGRLLQTRTQAEDEIVGDPIFGGGVLSPDQSDDPGEVVLRKRHPEKEPNVVVSGAQVFDNKGRIVEKFEPYFELESGFRYRPPGKDRFGQKATMFYDPIGRVARTLNPDGSEQRVIFGVPGKIDEPNLSKPDVFEPTPWEAYTYDANDLAPISKDPGTGERLADRAPRHHHFTPLSIVLDALGRTVLAIERNINLPEDPDNPSSPLPAMQEFTTESTYDIRGNLVGVKDALGRKAFQYTYDLANNPLRVENIDAGIRRMILDAAGNEIERRDKKGALILQKYDVSHRRTRLWARDAEKEEITLREHLIYGDGADSGLSEAAARGANLLGTLFQHYDEAGLLEFERYDFKGNVLEKNRRVITDDAILQVFPESTPDADWIIRAFRVNWDPLEKQEAALLDDKRYETSATYDALNRVKTLLYPKDVKGQRKELRPKYNRAGSLESVQLNDEVFVQHVAYNAKGQRSFVALGNTSVNNPGNTSLNGVMTCYAHDPRTFRLKRVVSTAFTKIDDGPFRPKPLSTPEDRKRNLLQDFSYDYDLIGNITHIHDRTPESGIPNRINALDRLFRYDALYRLKFASGRECDRPAEMPFDPIPRCNDLTKTRRYEESYRYDRLGNIEELNHAILNGQPRTNGFVRQFKHRPGTNQLTTMKFGRTTFDYKYDENGNMTDETTSRHFEWDHSDRMKVFRNQTLVADAENANHLAEPTVYAHYLYNSAGMRVKKFVRMKGGSVEVTEYVDGLFEFQRASGVENNTVHIMDGATRIATVRVGPPFPDDKTPAVKYHIGDHLGSSSVVLNRDGGLINREEYTPYGETSFGSFARKRYRYTGKERDEESGLNYHRARHYLPWLARWANTDPKSSGNPAWSPFCYTFANPLVFTDETGQQPDEANLVGKIQDYNMRVANLERNVSAVSKELDTIRSNIEKTADVYDIPEESAAAMKEGELVANRERAAQLQRESQQLRREGRKLGRDVDQFQRSTGRPPDFPGSGSIAQGQSPAEQLNQARKTVNRAVTTTSSVRSKASSMVRWARSVSRRGALPRGEAPTKSSPKGPSGGVGSLNSFRGNDLPQLYNGEASEIETEIEAQKAWGLDMLVGLATGGSTGAVVAFFGDPERFARAVATIQVSPTMFSLRGGLGAMLEYPKPAYLKPPPAIPLQKQRQRDTSPGGW
jgi:RHS repeat-associated protein